MTFPQEAEVTPINLSGNHSYEFPCKYLIGIIIFHALRQISECSHDKSFEI